MHPFLSLKSEETIAYRMIEELSRNFSISSEEIKSAVHTAWIELTACRNDIRQKGEETIQFLNETGTAELFSPGVLTTSTRK